MADSLSLVTWQLKKKANLSYGFLYLKWSSTSFCFWNCYFLFLLTFLNIRDQVQNRQTILSETFTVFSPKRFPGPVEPTFLSRTFSDQGVKMRIRKEHRLQAYVILCS